MSLFPQPNRPGTGPNQINNYFKQGSGSTTNDKFDWRMDWAQSANNRLFARMTDRVRQNNTPACFFCNGADTGFSNDDHGLQVVLNDTYTPGPTWVIDMYGAYTRWWEGQTAQGYGVASASDGRPFTQPVSSPLLPVVSAQNYTTLGNGSYNRYVRYLSTGIINVTKQLGDHSLKFGFNFDVNQINIRQDSAGSFNLRQKSDVLRSRFEHEPGRRGTLHGAGQRLEYERQCTRILADGYRPGRVQLQYGSSDEPAHLWNVSAGQLAGHSKTDCLGRTSL